MKIRLTPLTIEGLDEDNLQVFKLTAIDEGYASIEIPLGIDLADWRVINDAVTDALEMMFPEADDAP